MSRVAKSPVAVPAGVEIKRNGQILVLKVLKVNWNLLFTTMSKLPGRKRSDVCST